MAKQNLHLIATMLILGGCRGCNWGDDDTALDTAAIIVDTDDTTGGDDSGGGDVPHGVHGTIEGNVEVTLITTDENGDLVEVPWGDSCFDEKFPYGAIFVSAFTTDEATGVETYYGSDAIDEPSTVAANNTFSITVDTDAVDEVYLMAVLDKWDDRYISPSDPRGYHAVPITVHEGDVSGGIEVEILTDYWCGWSSGGGSGGSGWGSCPDCPPGWGNGWGWIWDGTGWVWVGGGWAWDGTGWVWVGSGPGGGGGWGGWGGGSGSCDHLVTVGGDLIVDIPYNGSGQDLATVLYLPGETEPYVIDYDLAATATAHGAEGTWGYSMCPDAGTFDAQGVWDSNANLLYDPADTWGQPVDAHGNPQDSISFGQVDILDQTMLVPVAGSGIDIVPFVRLVGTVDYEDGSFDDLLATSPDARVALVAAKYRPDGDFAEVDLEDQYDYEVWDTAELVGQSSLPFMLLGPSETTFYFWASCDLNDDGIFNGPGETFAYYGDGPLTTGTTSITGMEMTLRYY